ncbi:hypothetical protein B481_3400 [Planococcus halocryophilus Or1]|nr:hypothetical protein B481_3400 [Planococcus halocryophilus Or1]
MEVTALLTNKIMENEGFYPRAKDKDSRDGIGLKDTKGKSSKGGHIHL